MPELSIENTRQFCFPATIEHCISPRSKKGTGSRSKCDLSPVPSLHKRLNWFSASLLANRPSSRLVVGFPWLQCHVEVGYFGRHTHQRAGFALVARCADRHIPTACDHIPTVTPIGTCDLRVEIGRDLCWRKPWLLEDAVATQRNLAPIITAVCIKRAARSALTGRIGQRTKLAIERYGGIGNRLVGGCSRKTGVARVRQAHALNFHSPFSKVLPAVGVASWLHSEMALF